MLLALDLETTGLSSLADNILEVGWCLVHEKTFEPITDVDSRLVTTSPEQLQKMDEVVTAMHAASGLTEDLLHTENTMVVEDIEDLIIDDIVRNRQEGESVFLFGASVHFDHSFIENWMPRLNSLLHHRHYDVSALKMFFGGIGISVAGQDDRPTHRAAQDVIDELEVADGYRIVVKAMFHQIETGEQVVRQISDEELTLDAPLD